MFRRWSLAVALPLILGACSGTPLGTPPCSAASIVAVLAALENVPGYTFTASGTSLTPTPGSALGSGPYEYQSPRIELRGAYRAPDRSRLEVLAGRDAIPPVSVPGIFFLGADAIIVIGVRTWLVSPGTINEVPTDDLEPNLLLDVLNGAPEAGEVQWTSPRACSFGGQQRRDDVGLGSLSISVRVDVGPGALPHTIVEEWRFDQPGQPRKEYNLTYQPDFGQAPDIVAPGP
jgi:hypothetical protein